MPNGDEPRSGEERRGASDRVGEVDGHAERSDARFAAGPDGRQAGVTEDDA